ncbi:MAG: hypothetical protein AAF797_05440 [Planctomycetota bacterium]
MAATTPFIPLSLSSPQMAQPSARFLPIGNDPAVGFIDLPEPAPAFGDILDALQPGKAEPDPAEEDAELREAAEQLVSNALVKEVFAIARRDPLKSDLFNGGFTEDAFGAQLDQLLADRIVQSTNFPIVDRIHQSFQRKPDVALSNDRFQPINRQPNSLNLTG